MAAKQRTFTWNKHILILFVAVSFISASYLFIQQTPVPTTIEDFTLHGSQPLQSGTFTNPGQCDNCHGDYDENAEPAFNWRGSMMAQAQRDPIYLACLAIANQDAPEVGDLCIRCHTPKGWLEGRSTPTDGSALTIDDREGITCHYCHKMITPSPIGINPYPNDSLYNTDPPGGLATYNLDQNYLSLIDSTIPPTSANGMYICDDQDNRRGPYFDPQANHEIPYSSFHRNSSICGTCHDVSNPVYETQRDEAGNILGYAPGAFDSVPKSMNPYDMFPIERTYSEWLMSEYNFNGVEDTEFGGNRSIVSSCQDCHMNDVTGKGCNKNYAPVRDDLPLHDLTGGNTFVPDIIDHVFPGEADTVALAAGKLRAFSMLERAADMDVEVDQSNQKVIVKVTNETGHKLPSGYPEGRRIWIHLEAFSSFSNEYFEAGAYDTSSAVLNTSDTKVYEIKPGLSPSIASVVGLEPGVSFHFAINDTIYYDNRIPPRGFTNANFTTIQSPPIGYSYEDGQYWDLTEYDLPFIPDSVAASLYYQTISKEYVEFLKDNDSTSVLIQGQRAGQLLYDLWLSHGKSTPVLMTEDDWSLSTAFWLGLFGNEWENPDNWSSAIVPNDMTSAVIEAGTPFSPNVNSNNASCYNLIIKDGADFNVASSGSLEVNGDVMIDGENVNETDIIIEGILNIQDD